MSRHIIVDNSNTYSGLTTASGRLEPLVPWVGIRFDLDNFLDAIENRQEIATKSFIGSENDTADVFWNKARERGYDTYLLRRIANKDGSTSEQGVDEIAHLIIANTLLDYDGDQTLVIVSGDGKDSDFGTSFFAQAVRALVRGWKVEVWAFSDVMTGRYNPLFTEFRDKFKKVYLDDYYENITFVQTKNLRNPAASLPANLRRSAKPLAWPA